MSTALQKKVVLSTPLPETRENLEQFETSEFVIEVEVLWGDESLLHSAALEPGQSFTVGEGDSRGHADFLIGQKALGLQSLPLVMQHDGAPHIVVPREANATIRVPNENPHVLSAERGIAHSEPFGSHLHRLTEESEAEVRFGAFVFRVRSKKGGRAIGKGFHVDRAPLLYIAGAGIFLLLLIAAFAYLAPPSSGLNVELLDQGTMLAEYLTEIDETKDEPMPDWMVGAIASSAGLEGQANAGDEGAMGDEKAPKQKKRYSVSGPKDNTDPKLPREHAVQQTTSAGILGALAALSLPADGPVSPYAKANAQGADAIAAVGTMLGEVGTSYGLGGLGLQGTGRHGGGTGEGTIGLGGHATLGTIGRGCDGPGPCTGGYGKDVGIGDAERTSRVPRIRADPATVVGSLSKEAIRRTVHRHVNEVRHCYERELRSRPDLAGRVAVKFVIAPSGAVQASFVEKSSLNDANVEQCIAGAVRRWAFPAPDGGGVVAVTYPFMLSHN